jgi:hypothetical protein
MADTLVKYNLDYFLSDNVEKVQVLRKRPKKLLERPGLELKGSPKKGRN